MRKKTDKIKTTEKRKGVTGFQVLNNECIWMKAGVVNFRLCDNAYDCYTCPFDTSMRIAMGKNKTSAKHQEPEWVQNLKANYKGTERPCRHALTGRTDAPKICSMNYECNHCSYDQWLDEYDMRELTGKPGYKLASGYRMAEGYYYHIGHSWAVFENGGYVKVGFDDFLVKLFGNMNTIKLPSLGEKFTQNQEGIQFTRDNRKASVLSPVTGTVLAVNHKVLDHPEIAHTDPYQDGWLCVVSSDMPKKDVRKLYFGSDSFQWMEAESRKLMGMLGADYENLSATGGEAIGDVLGNFPELEWDLVTKTFLKN